jgi:glutaminyl-peptide cyclotransferase
MKMMLLLILPLMTLAACEKAATEVMTPAQTSEKASEETTQETSGQDKGQVYTYRIINRFPHDMGNFTQGFFIADGELYESTGKIGRSKLIRHNILSGGTGAERPLPNNIFGEGATSVGNKIISLSWRAGKGFIHDRETLEPLGSFAINTEGWGLTFDGDRLIMSDGSSRLRFLDPRSFEEIGTLSVTINGNSLGYLNELEWVEGEIWANVWKQDAIVRIDPVSGNVKSLIDMSGLYDQRRDEDEVLNGIAYDPETGRLFVTGKYWPEIFEIEIIEAL